MSSTVLSRDSGESRYSYRTVVTFNNKLTSSGVITKRKPTRIPQEENQSLGEKILCGDHRLNDSPRSLSRIFRRSSSAGTIVSCVLVIAATIVIRNWRRNVTPTRRGRLVRPNAAERLGARSAQLHFTFSDCHIRPSRPSFPLSFSRSIINSGLR